MNGEQFEPGVERTDRWRGIGVATVVAAKLGLLTRQPPLLLVGGVGVALLAYARLVAPPPATLAVRRTIDDADDCATDGGNVTCEVDDGEPVPASGGDGSDRRTGPAGADARTHRSVTLTVENVGDRTLPHVRLVDALPAGIEVVDGTPGIGTTLRPGDVATTTYTVAVRSGTHAFERPFAVVRDVAGVVERRARLPVDDGRTVEADATTRLRESPPLRTRSARFAGDHPTDDRGEGIAFESVREYRHGDAPSRVDWGRFARTGELATVDYRQDRGASVVVAVDARPVAVRAPSSDRPTAVERALDAASAIADRFDADGHQVGVARLGPDRRWIGPGSGAAHRRQIEALLAERPRSVTSPGAATPSGSSTVAWVRERLGSRAELFLLSPLLDGDAVELATRLDATGTPVTVVSPDPTDDATAGRALAGIERSHRVASLRGAGLPVVDWPADRPLERAIPREVTR
ncbi:hypothetical protein L593_09945 [Salinarchaeum sp. Harcht-Bsk1]|uniref:DUF58 domain-containing protein n=1 Tax=Salinarchaeum sp. Harcht-Bsk1 TaxID=1333523 RepID=UPI00034228EA|nr:DUF58 domain-containing protein [Salinarchaeum sp. Harcht-Bsk1]AGN01934.1 hypothetical protein L593_09945 [Salinarchaeum sp. Harcht-Bsk1]